MVGPFEIALIFALGSVIVVTFVAGLLARLRRSNEATSATTDPTSEEIASLRDEIAKVKEHLAEITLALDEARRSEGRRGSSRNRS